MTGEELDKRIRVIFENATRATVLSSTMALVEIGFTPRQAFSVIIRLIETKE